MSPSASTATTAPRARARSRLPARVRVPVWRRIALAVGSALLVLFFLAVLERVVYAGDVMPGVEVDGADVATRSEEDAFRELSALAAELEAAPIRARIDGKEFVADPSLIALDVDELGTLRAARAAGRSGNPVEQTLGAVLRRFRPDRVDLDVAYSDRALDGVLDGWQAQVIDGSVEGDLRFEGTDVIEVEPRAGTGILRDEARELLSEELRTAERDPVELPVGRVEPQISPQEVARAARRARAILAGDVVVQADGSTVTITPAQLAGAMGTRVRERRLELTIDPDRLRLALGDALAAVETAPVDAGFAVTPAGTVDVVPSRNGRQVDLAAVGDAILDGQRRIVAPVKEVVPERDTEWAQSLGIVEQVSTFTTRHNPGEARVVNIHRAADLLNGYVVEPGEVFSLNEAIGPRTPERGFVSAPVFYGEFTEDFGGGVSQLATTVFNAVFWGGYEDVYHKPHTIYISRYPMGREATVNYPDVDLKFRNDSKAGVLIRTSYTATSITVTFYGDKEGKVVEEEGRNILAERPAETRYYDCPGPPGLDDENVCATLTLGETEKVENGYAGYDVEFYRVITRPGQPPQRERFFWRYKMQPTQILVGTAPPPTSAPPVPPPPAGATTTTGPPAPPATPAGPPPPAG